VKYGGQPKAGVLMSAFQQLRYWADFEFVSRLTPEGISRAARAATRFAGFCPDCRRFEVL
jgi:hypothetical protein